MAARRAVFWPPGRILAQKSVFCYRTQDFVNGPFVTLDDIFDLVGVEQNFVLWQELPEFSFFSFLFAMVQFARSNLWVKRTLSAINFDILGKGSKPPVTENAPFH